MGWSRKQNPTGVNNPAIRDIPVDPLDITTTKADERQRQRTLARRSVPAPQPQNLPIAANARKAEGFAPTATSPGQ